MQLTLLKGKAFHLRSPW